MKRLPLTIFALLLCAGFVVNTSPVQSFRAEQRGAVLVVEWKSRDDVRAEQHVARYVLKRTWRNMNTEVVRVEPRGPGFTYEYRDEGVYKMAGEALEYELSYINSSNEEVLLAKLPVNYTSTAVRRTWGSIKAMFQ
jgi:hypothetical protein